METSRSDFELRSLETGGYCLCPKSPPSPETRIEQHLPLVVKGAVGERAPAVRLAQTPEIPQTQEEISPGCWVAAVIGMSLTFIAAIDKINKSTGRLSIGPF